MTVWAKYFVREFLKSLVFFLVIFYGLYVLIDYASHSSSFHRNHVEFHWGTTLSYYASEFVYRLEVLLPFALLITTIRILTDLNTHHELVALLSSGLSYKKLMMPFICIGLFATGLVYLSEELVLPKASFVLKKIDELRTSEKHRAAKEKAVQHLILDDESILLFQNYQESQNRFYDVFWILNHNEVYRMKYLILKPETPPTGYWVEHFVRNEKGVILQNSFDNKSFENIQIKDITLAETIKNPEELAISSLLERITSLFSIDSEKEAASAAIFLKKLLMPWLCLFAIIAPAPFCLKFSRKLPIFFIYAGSLFALVAFYLFMNATVLLGKRQVFPPLLVEGIPFLLITCFLLWRYSRAVR